MAGDGGILVVGAGTSGLALALQADAHGAAVRVVERRERLRRPSRALILHPRTLEGLRPLGVTEAVLARADRSPVVDLHLGRRVVTARLEDVRLPGTAFPHPVLVRQADVEEVLREALAARGVPVERGTALTGLAGRTAVLERAGTRERAPFRFLAGCDGPDSTARALTGVPWRGRPYRADILLADLELDGLAPDRAHVVAAAGGIVFLFAIGEAAPGGCSSPPRRAPRRSRSGSRARPCRWRSCGPRSPRPVCPPGSPGWRGPRGSGCSGGWPSASGPGTCSWWATPPTPTPPPAARG
ncbi:hypothetical protein KFL01_14210 [Kocuria flava]|uniref:FAD-binding domain-containing protein n=1 Tax=Kocuria flava TaxID=446860 RepID=A0ABQ0X469_9MICC|nr:hypothetical protein KFL01_14210 [Kocuria flava]